MSEYYKKYIDKLNQGCTIAIWTLDAIRKIPLEKIDERIQACDVLITKYQEVRRWLVYFKNTNTSITPPPPPPK